MAGIGFELRKLLKKNTLLSVVKAYGLAGLISSGPWILSIFSLLIIGIICTRGLFSSHLVVQFLVMVTYLMAGSLIISGIFQLLLTRFVSDQLFVNKPDRIVPNLFGAMWIMTVVTGLLGLSLVTLLDTDAAVKALLVSSLVLLSNQWLIVIFLSGMKDYLRILTTMAACYSLMVFLSILLPGRELRELLFVFTLSQALLTFTFLYNVIRDFPTQCFISFEFIHRKKAFYSLMLCGFLYNLGVWGDKFVFWWQEETSQVVLGFFRASYIYDLPIFIAYLAIVPGMAVFLMRMETDFAQACLQFYRAVREGATLHSILQLKEKMVLACRQGIYEMFKVQGITLALLLVWAKDILSWLNIDQAYLHLLYIDLVGVSLQVLVMAVLNVMFYLDKRYAALSLSGFMALSNVTLAYISIELGPIFYGYGFALTMLMTTLLGLTLLSRQFEELEYQTFMLQRN